MKTQRKVKTKLTKLIQRHGSKKRVAELLDIHVSYITKMLGDTTPGKRLYRDICELIEKIDNPRR